MLVELDGDQFPFQVISDTGKTIDSGFATASRTRRRMRRGRRQRSQAAREK